MEHLWIPIAIGGGLFQALRMALLKMLNRDLSGTVATYVRVIVGLPIMLAFVGLAMTLSGEGRPDFSGRFLLMCLGTAITQFVPTVLFVYLFRLGNFAVGFMLTKIDVVFAALIGTALFSEQITPKGWLAILVTVAGVVVVSAGKLGGGAFAVGGKGLFGAVFSRATQVGLLVGLGYSFSYLFIREATLELPAGSFATRSGWTMVVSTTMQLVIVGAWLLWREAEGLGRIRRHWRLALLTGVVSALGSICWFTAAALQNVSYVAAVAQTQMIFAVAISWWWFQERIHRLELVGIAVIVAGVLLFRL
jgi:drug/metabolite transporter (DMT)-like permease